MKTLIVFWSTALLVSSAVLADTHYVDISNATPSDPYTSWGTAATNIQDAIDAASSNDTVLVADGTYDSGGVEVYSMKNRIAITKAIAVESINGPTNTFLVGEGPIGSFAMRCVYMTNGAELIGFTLTNGHTRTAGDWKYEWSGGGVLCDNGGTVSNCIISGNSAYDVGGVLCYQGGTLNNCTISGNSAGIGGGVLCYLGGTLNNCMLSGNSASHDGGGVLCYLGGTLNNCMLTGNSANTWGGGAFCEQGGVLNNCTISSNSAGGGGGVRCYQSGTLKDCTISGNSADIGGGVLCNSGGTLIGCTINSNSTSGGGGGGVFCYLGGTLNDCTISSNTASVEHAGGVRLKQGGTLIGCTISDNTAPNGAGVRLEPGGMVINCTISGNSAAEDGGGVYSEDGGTLNNCTISKNSANRGGGVICHGSGAFLNNCIVWNNSLGENWDGTGSWINCCTTPSKGVNCITNDPQFVASSDYHLLAGSPCIDAGITIAGIVDDIEGTPRPLDGDNNGSALFDIGAYEFFNPAADSDGDGLTDGQERGPLGTSPTSTNTDGDAAGDYDEYVADTDGTDSNDWFRITAIEGTTVWFQSSAERQYTLLWCSGLIDGYWGRTRGQIRIMGSGGVDSLTDPYNDPACFYRVEVEIP
jgi:predicted outer membrane repeat protein